MSKPDIYDIHKRIYLFVIRVLRLVKQLPKTSENIIIINQITRSVTSIGANDQEADGVISRKDFIHKYSIVRKEAKETDYWLYIISDTNPVLELRMNDLLQESNELVKIISSILYNARSHKKK